MNKLVTENQISSSVAMAISEGVLIYFRVMLIQTVKEQGELCVCYEIGKHPGKK